MASYRASTLQRQSIEVVTPANAAAALAAKFLPPLPPLPCPYDYRGPSPWSNWVIKGRVLAGAYPASPDDFETDALLTRILELGINTFVCLQAEFSLNAPESAWRAGQALRPYVKDAQRLLIQARKVNNARINQTRLDLLHLPILDGSVTSDQALSRLADDCCQRVLDGERLYIHCWGGHGRTGTLVAVMLSRLYGLSCPEALAYTQALHDVRRCPQGVRSPQTQVQVEQVKRILAAEADVPRGVGYRWPERPLSPEAGNLPSLLSSMHPLAHHKSKVSAPPALLGALAKEAAAAAVLDPPIRADSLIPAGHIEAVHEAAAAVASVELKEGGPKAEERGAVVSTSARAGQVPTPHPIDVWDPYSVPIKNKL